MARSVDERIMLFPRDDKVHEIDTERAQPALGIHEVLAHGPIVPHLNIIASVARSIRSHDKQGNVFAINNRLPIVDHICRTIHLFPPQANR